MKQTCKNETRWNHKIKTVKNKKVVGYYRPSHCRKVNVLLTNRPTFFAVLLAWFNHVLSLHTAFKQSSFFRWYLLFYYYNPDIIALWTHLWILPFLIFAVLKVGHTTQFIILFSSTCRSQPIVNKKDGYRQLNVRHLGSLRPWDHRGKNYMDRKRIQCLSNASQHVPVYLQPFSRNSSRIIQSSQF